MTPIAEHKCETLPKIYDIVKFYDSGWVFDAVDEGYIYDFKYCPYCGCSLT